MPTKKIYKRTKKIIGYSGALLLLIFGWLELSNLPIVQIFNDQYSNWILRFSLIIYFAAWTTGPIIDMDAEEKVLEYVPNKDRLGFSSYAFIFVIVILFGALCYVSDFLYFDLILTAFFILNIISWVFLKDKFLKTAFEESNKKYIADGLYLKSECLKILNNYLYGNWQIKRFIAGFIVLILINFLVFTNLSNYISEKIGLNSSQFIKGIGVLIFIAVMEGWIWYIRIKRWFLLSYIDELNDKYEFILKK